MLKVISKDPEREGQLVYESILLFFMGLSYLGSWLVPAKFGLSGFNSISLPFLNGPLAFVSICTFFALLHYPPLRKHKENILLILASLYSVLLSYYTYLLGYNDEMMRLKWVFIAVLGGYFSSYQKTVFVFAISYLSSAAMHLALPPGSFPYPLSSFLISTPLIIMAYLFVVSRSIIINKRLKESEKKLLKKTVELDTIFNSLHAMVAYKDANNIFLNANQQLADYLGMKREGLIGKSLYELFPYELAKKFHDEDLEILRTGKSMTNLVDEIVTPGSKKVLWLNCHKAPYYDENGKIAGLVVSAEDITEQMTALQRLKASEERFRMIFENAPVGIMFLEDCTKPFLKVNRAIINVLGYTEEELLSMTPMDITHEEDKDFVMPMIEEAKREGKSFITFEKRFVHKKGKIIYTAVSLHLVQESADHEYIIGIIRDITQQVEYEKNLQEYSRKLEESNQNLQEFAYAASHDLREPLRTVVSYVQLLKKYLPQKGLKPEIGEFTHFIVDGAKRMESQINALLDYSRVGRCELEFKNVDLNQILFNVCKSLKLQIAESNAVVEAVDLPCVTADAFQMEALFQNLLSNSIKYRKPDVQPIIEISAQKNEKGWLFLFTDNGIGIENEYLEKIFSVFSRLHTQSQIPGSGVGLAICKRIVQRHGGKIWAISNPGEGTAFCFTLANIDTKAGQSLSPLAFSVASPNIPPYKPHTAPFQ